MRQSGSIRSICNVAVERSLLPSYHLNPPPIDLSQQIGNIHRNHVDNALFQRLLADKLAAERTAASAQSALRLRSSANPRMYATASLTAFRSPADSGAESSRPGSSPHSLCPMALVRLWLRLRWSSNLHGCRRADVGGRRHRRNVTCVQQICAGAGGTCSGWCDECHNWYLRGQRRANHVAHRRIEAAGSIQLENDQPSIALARPFQRTHEVVARRRSDRVSDIEHQGNRAILATRLILCDASPDNASDRERKHCESA